MSEDLWRRLAVPPGAPQAAPDAASAEGDELWRRLTVPPPPPPAATPPAEPASGFRRFMQGVTDQFYGTGQLLNRAVPELTGPIQRSLGLPDPQGVDALVRERERNYQDQRAAAGDTGTDWYRTGGQVVSGLPIALATGGATLPGAIAGGAIGGAAQGLTQPATEMPPDRFVAEKVDQAIGGGIGGAVGGAAGNLLGRLISPRVSPNVAALRDAGVEMTPGQIMGGTLRRAESAGTSVPIFGDRVIEAQTRSLESFNRATANRVLEPLKQSIPDDAPVGRELIADVERRIGAAYSEATAKTVPFGPDEQFIQDVAEQGRRFLTPQSRQTFMETLRDRVISRFQGGPLDGETFKTIDSELGSLSRSYSGSTSAAEQEIGKAYRGVQRVLRDLMMRQNPEAAPLMRAADAAEAQFVRMRGAAGMLGAQEGVFTPSQLLNAAKRGDYTPGDRAYARGDALMQDLAEAGRAVLPSNVPDSGTAGRLMTAGAMGGAASGSLPWWYPLVAGAAGTLYSPPMTRATQALLASPRPAAVGLLGDAVASGGGAVAVPLGGLLLGPPEQRPQ